MARYTYPSDQLEDLHDRAGLDRMAKLMDELFEGVGWTDPHSSSSQAAVQWQGVEYGVFNLRFDSRDDVTLLMAPDWEGQLGIVISAVDTAGASETFGEVVLPWTGDADRDAAMIVGAVVARVVEGRAKAVDRPRYGDVPAESLMEFADLARTYAEGSYSPLARHYEEFDESVFEIEATKILGTGERVYYDYPGFFHFWVGHVDVLATPDWDGPSGLGVQLDIYEAAPPNNGDLEFTEGVGPVAIYLPWTGSYEIDAALWVGAVVAVIQDAGVDLYAPGRPLLGLG